MEVILLLLQLLLPEVEVEEVILRMLTPVDLVEELKKVTVQEQQEQLIKGTVEVTVLKPVIPEEVVEVPEVPVVERHQEPEYHLI
jgi:hypothetical protein